MCFQNPVEIEGVSNNEMIRNNVDKKKIEIKREKLDKLLLLYIKDI